MSHPFTTGITSSANFLKHHTQIVTDIGAALQAKDRYDYGTFGKELVDAIALTILGKEVNLLNLNYNQFRPVQVHQLGGW